VRKFYDGTEISDLARDAMASGRMILFHGTAAVFDRFSVTDGAKMNFGNCHVGIHLTTDPGVAADYAEYSERRESAPGRILVVEIDPGPLGIIIDRDAYLDMTTQTAGIIRDEYPNLIGLIPDELGDDLCGACLIFDPDRIRIVGELAGDLMADFEWSDELPYQWSSAEFRSLDDVLYMPEIDDPVP